MTKIKKIINDPKDVVAELIDGLVQAYHGKIKKLEGVNALVIAGCSRRVNYDVFRFDGCVVDRVNLREQVVWSHPRSEFPKLTQEEIDSGDAFDRVQMLAEDYLRMGIAHVQATVMPKPYIADDISSDVLVVGGGVTGLTAALEGARAGYRIHVIEKDAELGGFAPKLYRQIPEKVPFDVLAEPVKVPVNRGISCRMSNIQCVSVPSRFNFDPGNISLCG